MSTSRTHKSEEVAESAGGTLWDYTIFYGLLGGLHASSRRRYPQPRQAKDTEDRAEACDVTDTHAALDAQDHLLFEIDPDARYRHWLVCQPVCLCTGGVNMAISTFEILP